MTFASRDAFPARGGIDDSTVDRLGRGEARGVVAPAPYVELHAHSAYSFLDGASMPEEPRRERPSSATTHWR